MIEKDPIAAANAKKLIQTYFIKYPRQYTIEQIINAEGLAYQEENLSGCAGNIVFSERHGVITVNSNIKEQTQKIFTAAHELGHFENERTKFKACSFEDIAGIKQTSPVERSANYFASEFLIHQPWFEKYIKGKKLDGRLLKDTASYFNVSLSAAAIRYTDIGSYPCAIAMSTDGKVKWSVINKNFPVQFIRWGVKVSDLSYTSDFFKGDEIPTEAEDVPARAWFRDSFYIKDSDRVFEFNIPMKNYNSILTVLYF